MANFLLLVFTEMGETMLNLKAILEAPNAIFELASNWASLVLN